MYVPLIGIHRVTGERWQTERPATLDSRVRAAPRFGSEGRIGTVAEFPVPSSEKDVQFETTIVMPK